jgi:hypothetical protein
MPAQPYAIIATVAGTYYGLSAIVGEVVNTVMWDGDTSTWSPPAGTEARVNSAAELQIGQTTTV